MALLANLRPTDRVLDPCCGAGTLLVEAARTQPAAHYHGLDISPTALTATRTNAAHSGIGPPTLTRADAARLPLATASVDAILVNPPWSRQVPAAGLLSHHPGRLWPELRRTATASARLVCLQGTLATGPCLPGWKVTATLPVSLMGSYARIITACPY
jgi:23S rRNA G2445 N2-methylase RlmL